MKKLLILLSALAMLCAFSFTAAASDFNFYGSLRFKTFSEDFSKETNPTGANVSDTDTQWGTIGTSRIGSKIKLSDEITGVFELAVGDEDLTLRHYYGEYDFGLGKILIGQTWHPVGIPFGSYSNQVGLDDGGLLSYGVFYSGRDEMIKLTFGDFQIAFIEPNTPGTNSKLSNVITGTDINCDTSLPQIAMGYSYKYENVTLDAVGAYQTYEESNDSAGKSSAGKSYDINSYVFKLGAKGEFGPFMLGATYGWGQNVNSMGAGAVTWIKNGAPRAGAPRAQATKYDETSDGIIDIKDINTIGYTIVGAYKATDMLRFEAGYGYNESEAYNDGAYQADDDACSYYLQAAITIADGFVVTPEIGRVDFKSWNGIDNGDITYFGAKWQINF